MPSETSTSPLWRYATLTDVGRVRQNNEDAIVILPEQGVAVLADGMGGYNAGEVASALATELVASALAQWLAESCGEIAPEDIARAMHASVASANHAIFEAAHTRAECLGMGTTLVMAVCHGDCVHVGHVGDSRAYLWRGGELTRITRDHSLLQERMDAGLMTPEEAAESGFRGFVTRALGVEDWVQLDVSEMRARTGDVILLCSDGLTDMVDDSRLASLLAQSAELHEAARALVDEANANGGRDNVSVALCRFTGWAKKTGFLSKLQRK